MLTWIIAGAGCICLIYYVIVILYAGVGTSCSWVWLLGALFFWTLAASRHYRKIHPERVPKWLVVSAITFLAAAVTVFVAVEILVFSGAAKDGQPGLDYVIVLGAQVREDGISNSLKKRLDKAIEYSQENPETVLVLSGGKGPDEPVSEAEAMYDYLLYNGVPKSQMLLEPMSTSTVENIAYSRLVIDRAEEEKKQKAVRLHEKITAPGPFTDVEDKPLQIGILTSDFHVFRAVAIAEKWGIPDAKGISAESDLILFPHLCVRECLAILKDKLVGNM